MMYKIICDYCDQELLFEKISDKPEICDNCNTALTHIEPEKLSEEESTESNAKEQKADHRMCLGLTLIYQKTGEKISIVQTKTILGREGVGSDVLGQVPQISRSHCLIEYKDDQYSITDLDSLNGTFLGASKVNCKENPSQKIQNDDFLFLGREPFLIQLHYENSSQTCTGTDQPFYEMGEETKSNPGDESVKFRKIVYRCKVCGTDYEKKEEIQNAVCRKCSTFNEWDEVQI